MPKLANLPTSWLPTRAELDAATARTAAALADPAASLADVQRAAQAEEAVHQGYLHRPGADAELQAEAELEAGALWPSLCACRRAAAVPPISS
jgi:hypothetical protein